MSISLSLSMYMPFLLLIVGVLGAAVGGLEAKFIFCGANVHYHKHKIIIFIGKSLHKI